MLEEEPSVSEILSSIRQVLSKEAEALNTNAPRPDFEDDGMDEMDTFPILPQERQKEAPTEEFIVELTPQMRLNSESLLSQETALKAQAALEKLNSVRLPQIPQATLENEMRPLLRAWLNAHLPEIVERVVTQEVRRVINGK